MALTAELVATCHREVSDPGPSTSAQLLGDDEFLPAARDILARKPAGPFWLFAYGSLIWKPEIAHTEMRRAVAHGWHRAFSMKIERFRGSQEQPGYMMCLDLGGLCEGVVLRLSDDDPEMLIEKLLRREVSRKGALEAVRWVRVMSGAEEVTALTFYAGPALLENYLAGRPLAEVAHGLARACGHWGSGADYLFNTVAHLEGLGIQDDGLWVLQALVANEILKSRDVKPANEL
jgi:cation transport protein ChaC